MKSFIQAGLEAQALTLGSDSPAAALASAFGEIFAPQPLKARAAEGAGQLSSDERRLLPSEVFGSIRERHAKRLEAATFARCEVVKLLDKGLPERSPEMGAMDVFPHAAIHKAIRRYVVESRLLWSAAELVCDMEELPDDGEREGIVWEVPL